ncbi:MAG: DEAD/DEAH box helicase [Gammaproteobacteria bacterium]|nr:DEAD/DEAH box helicase [Gammaproteobacteria bacterium]MBT5685566.1 DEAD/DEAH box helicase [Gammaproteobacteria bacterium]
MAWQQPEQDKISSLVCSILKKDLNLTSLLDLPLHKQLFKALDTLGFSEATEVQDSAIPAILEGRDVMVSAKTGSGKTAAFLLPMLDHMLRMDAPGYGTRGLILLPTRELALQTVKTFEKLAKFTPIKCGIVIGGEAYKHQIALLRKNPEVIIATPGRLVEHLDKRSIDFNDLEFLVLDEADRMLDMGFTEDMNTIAASCRQQRQNLLFSATLKHRNFGRIQDILDDPASIEVDSFKQGHSQITQQMVLADGDDHKRKLIKALVEEEKAEKVFVFCKTRAQCSAVGQHLAATALKVGYLHGEIPQSDRKQVLNRFRDGKLQVLVATDVAARGLDVSDVDLVINYTVAHSGDDHVHRVGRTGRAGKQGKAVTLVNRIDWNKNSSIERYLKIRFELRSVKGLKADYTGPGKLKKSGKAAGTKKKSRKQRVPKSPAPKKRARNKKNIGKGRKAKGSETHSDEASAYAAKGSHLYSKYRKKTPE